MSGQDSPDKMNLDPIYVVREERVQTHGTVKEALECSGRTIYEINSHELHVLSDEQHPITEASDADLLGIFARTLVHKIEKGKESNHNPYFSRQEALLSAIIIRVGLDPNIPALDKNVSTVYYTLFWESDKLGELFDETKMPEETKPCLEYYREFLELPKEQRIQLIAVTAADMEEYLPEDYFDINFRPYF